VISEPEFGDQPLRQNESPGAGCGKGKHQSPKEPWFSEEAVFCGEAGSLCARAQPQLAVDRAQVPIDGA
jgi:hypothetical protein